jgi:hypothetical protein
MQPQTWRVFVCAVVLEMVLATLIIVFVPKLISIWQVRGRGQADAKSVVSRRRSTSATGATGATGAISGATGSDTNSSFVNTSLNASRNEQDLDTDKAAHKSKTGKFKPVMDYTRTTSGVQSRTTYISRISFGFTATALTAFTVECVTTVVSAAVSSLAC